MTRSYAAARATRVTQPITRPVLRNPRDPSIRRLSFTCFRLVAIEDPEPGEGPFSAIELLRTSSTMGVFRFKTARPWR